MQRQRIRIRMQAYDHRVLDQAVAEIVAQTTQMDAMVVFGAPVRHAGRLYNCAVAARVGRILGIVPKSYLADEPACVDINIKV